MQVSLDVRLAMGVVFQTTVCVAVVSCCSSGVCVSFRLFIGGSGSVIGSLSPLALRSSRRHRDCYAGVRLAAKPHLSSSRIRKRPLNIALAWVRVDGPAASGAAAAFGCSTYDSAVRSGGFWASVDLPGPSGRGAVWRDRVRSGFVEHARQRGWVPGRPGVRLRRGRQRVAADRSVDPRRRPDRACL